MFKIALLLVALFATLAIVHGQTTVSICDRYSTALKVNNTQLMTTFVSTAFGRVLGQNLTRIYFTGVRGRNSTNQTVDYTKDTAAFQGLAAGLIAFFGNALGCSDADFPVYSGEKNMETVHKNNQIDNTAFEVFNQLLVNVAQVLGFNHTDYDALATVLEGFRSSICLEPDCTANPPHTITVGSRGLWYTPAAGYSFPAGATIVWIWTATNSTTHSVIQSGSAGACTPLANGFNSGQLSGATGGAKNFSQTFNTPGTYFYYCGVANHCAQGMTGTFTITAAATTGTTGATTATTAASTATTAASTATTAATTATTAASTATTAASTATTAASTTRNNGSSGAATVFVSMALLAVALLF